jgi:hypothetical protein
VLIVSSVAAGLGRPGAIATVVRNQNKGHGPLLFLHSAITSAFLRGPLREAYRVLSVTFAAFSFLARQSGVG